MKFSVSSSALLSLLATTGKVISNKNTLPILDYFLMELNGTTLKVTTSDLETTLIGSIEVDSVESEGTIAAPGKLMLDSLKEFPELPRRSTSMTRTGRSASSGRAARSRSRGPRP